MRVTIKVTMGGGILKTQNQFPPPMKAVREKTASNFRKIASILFYEQEKGNGYEAKPALQSGWPP